MIIIIIGNLIAFIASIFMVIGGLKNEKLQKINLKLKIESFFSVIYNKKSFIDF